MGPRHPEAINDMVGHGLGDACALSRSRLVRGSKGVYVRSKARAREYSALGESRRENNDFPTHLHVSPNAAICISSFVGWPVG
jgi:hypothetical protein